jgi:hypothetical protein
MEKIMSLHPWVQDITDIVIRGLEKASDDDVREALKLLNDGNLNPEWLEAAFELLRQGDAEVIRFRINQHFRVLEQVFDILYPNERPAA